MWQFCEQISRSGLYICRLVMCLLFFFENGIKPYTVFWKLMLFFFPLKMYQELFFCVRIYRFAWFFEWLHHILWHECSTTYLWFCYSWILCSFSFPPAVQLAFALPFLFSFRLTLAVIGISLFVIGTTLVGQLPRNRWNVFLFFFPPSHLIGLSLFFLFTLKKIFLAMLPGMGDLSSLNRDWTCAPALKVWCLNHWTTREVLDCPFS